MAPFVRTASLRGRRGDNWAVSGVPTDSRDARGCWCGRSAWHDALACSCILAVTSGDGDRGRAPGRTGDGAIGAASGAAPGGLDAACMLDRAPHRNRRPVRAVEAPATCRAITGQRAQVGAKDGGDASVLGSWDLILAVPDAQHPCHPTGIHGLDLCGCQCHLVPLRYRYYIMVSCLSIPNTGNGRGS